MSKRSVNVGVSIEEVKGDQEKLIKKFMKKVKKEKIIENFLDRRYHVKPSVKKRHKKLNKIRKAKVNASN